MPGKPTYEELEQRNKDLEKQTINCKGAEETFQESENLFKNVTNSIKELLVLLDQNFKVKLINTTLAQAFKISVDESIGKHCYELFYGRNEICEGCPAVKVLNDEEVTSALRYRPDGRIYDRTAFPFLEENGDITGVVVIGCDITEQKQAEEKMRESEKKYRNLLETTSQGYWMIDPELKNIEVNPSLCKMLGYRPHEMLGKTPFDFVDDENRKIFIEQFSKIPTTPHRSYEITLKKKNGKDVNTFINATTIRDESGEVQGAFALITDITDMKQTEQKLKERERELEIKNIRLEEMNVALKVLLEKKDEDKKKLEGNILSNVNNLVLPYVNKLKNVVLDEKQETYLEVLKSNINEIISEFSNTLLSNYMNLTPAEIQVANLVKQGKQTKEIANLLDVSINTIKSHRESIRKKIGIKNKKANLKSYLLSLG